MILTDIAQVLYAPKRAFKKIVANPKYLGVIIIFLLFIGVQVAYEYGQLTKIYLETTSPLPGLLQTFNNATSWNASTGVQLTNNFNDYYNNSVYVGQLQRPLNDPLGYYKLFGNFSLQIQSNNTSNFIVALTNTTGVDCSQTGFKNFSLTMKLIEPQSAPENVTLRLYSMSDNDYYTYDLTRDLANASAINQWGNVTIGVGPDAKGWNETGHPEWVSITSLTLQFTYPSNTDVTMRIGALFFHGLFMSPLQYDSTGFIMRFVQVFSLQFLFSWLILTVVIYFIFKALKSQVVWKPLFVALGFAMFVMVIRGIVNIVATLTIPTIYYPYDASPGVIYDAFASLYYPSTIGTLTANTIAVLPGIDASLTVFRGIITAMFIVSYVWLGALTGLAIKELRPEMSTLKCFIYAAAGVGVTILALYLFIGIV